MPGVYVRRSGSFTPLTVYRRRGSSWLRPSLYRRVAGQWVLLVRGDITVADAGTGTETASVTVGTPKSGADTGVGTERVAGGARAGGDGGTGTDTISVDGPKVIADTATGTDAHSLVAPSQKSGSDAGTGTDLFTATESGKSGSDAGTAVEAASVTTSRTRTETGTGTEAGWLDANLVTGDDYSFEGDTIGSWTGQGSGGTAPVLTNAVNVAAKHGTHTLRVAWGTATSNPCAELWVGGLTIGATYQASLWYWRPDDGSPDGRIVIPGTPNVYGNVATGAYDWHLTTVIFTASSDWHRIQVHPAAQPAAGNLCYIDAVTVVPVTVKAGSDSGTGTDAGAKSSGIFYDRKITENNLGTGDTASFSGPTSFAAGEYVVIWMCCDNAAGTNLPTIANVRYRNNDQSYTVVAQHDAANTAADGSTRGFIIVIPSINVSGGASSLMVTLSNPVTKIIGMSAVFTGASTTAVSGPTGTTGNISQLPDVPQGALVLALADWETNAALGADNDVTGGEWRQPGDTEGSDGALYTSGGGAAANLSMMAQYKITTSGPTNQDFRASGVANQGGQCAVALAPA